MVDASPLRPLEQARLHLLHDVIRVRLLAVPLVATFAIVIAFMDPAPWRIATLAVVLPVLIGLSVHERLRLKDRRGEGWAWHLNIAGIVVAQLVMALVTGGLVSPAIVASLLLTFAVAVTGSDETSPLRWGLWTAQVSAFFVYAAIQTDASLPRFIPSMFAGMAEVGPAAGPWVIATIYALLASGTALLGRRVGLTVRGVYGRRLAEREHTLELLREHAAELNQLTAEVAHELKNPMASVKGLAGLLGRSASGKDEERVRVLRQEVDRMQSVLEELANSSRPLVPLNRQATDLTEIGREVLELHAGLAAERGVGLELEVVDELVVDCDPRKVRQILINLIQNALDVAPAQSMVTLGIVAAEDGARLEVRDHGPGLAPEVADRVFERGVTTKPEGFGIGLGVARSLARQHGGELELASAEAGCVARLSLPRAESPRDGVAP